MHALSSPTRREAFLLFVVFVSLLWFSTTNSGVSDSDVLYINDSKISYPRPVTLAEHWRTRITWEKGFIPNTRVVSHAPGTSIILALLNTLLAN